MDLVGSLNVCAAAKAVVAVVATAGSVVLVCAGRAGCCVP